MENSCAKAVRAILERKYSDLCDPTYIDKVVKSFPLEGVSLREPKYIKAGVLLPTPALENIKNIILIANEGHEIHHVKEHG